MRDIIIPGPMPHHEPTNDPEPWLRFDGFTRAADNGVNLYGSGYRWKPRPEYDRELTDFEKLQKLYAARYRVPVVSALNPRESFVAALVVPQPDDELARIWEFIAPEEADAELLGQYIQFRLSRWYSEHFISQLRERELDYDPGVNTVSFVKTLGGWRFSRASWRTGTPFIPTRDDLVQYPTLLELLDRERQEGTYRDEKWDKFKLDNELDVKY